MAEKSKVIREITVDINDVLPGRTVGSLLKTNDRSTDKVTERAEQNLTELEALIALNPRADGTPYTADNKTKLADLADSNGKIRIPLFDAFGDPLLDAAKLGSVVAATGYKEGSDLRAANAQRQEELAGKRTLSTDLITENMAASMKAVGEAQYKRWEEEQKAAVAGGTSQDAPEGDAKKDVPAAPPAAPKDPLAGFVAHETQKDLAKPQGDKGMSLDLPKDMPQHSAAVPKEKTKDDQIAKVDQVTIDKLGKLGDKMAEKGAKHKYVGSGPQAFPDGEETKLVQQGLVDLGYKLGDSGEAKNGVDGDAGQKTREAIVEFQKKHGIEPVDGRAGKDTVKTLKEALVKEKEKGKEARGAEKAEEKGEGKTGQITVTPKDDMQIADLAGKLGVDDNKKADFLKAVHAATKTQGTQIGKGQSVTVDGDSMGIKPSEAKAAAEKGVDVKPAAGR